MACTPCTTIVCLKEGLRFLRMSNDNRSIMTQIETQILKKATRMSYI